MFQKKTAMFSAILDKVKNSLEYFNKIRKIAKYTLQLHLVYFDEEYSSVTARADDEDYSWPVIPIILTVIPFIPVYIEKIFSDWLQSKLNSQILKEIFSLKNRLICKIFRTVFSILETIENLVAKCILLALYPLLICVHRLVSSDDEQDMWFFLTQADLSLFVLSKYLYCKFEQFSCALKSVVLNRTTQGTSLPIYSGTNRVSNDKNSGDYALSNNDSPVLTRRGQNVVFPRDIPPNNEKKPDREWNQPLLLAHENKVKGVTA